MDITFGGDAAKTFVTNVGLITSTGPHGPNVMAAEWTHHISYSPGLVAICPSPKSATAENIRVTREFGVSIASSSQKTLASLAGNYTGKEVQKVEALKELGFSFREGKVIKAPMVDGSSLIIECTVKEWLEPGDHLLIIGEAVHVEPHPEHAPLVYHQGKYWSLGESLVKTPKEERDRMAKVVESFKKRVNLGC